jgi:hypothetical protein
LIGRERVLEGLFERKYSSWGLSTSRLGQSWLNARHITQWNAGVWSNSLITPHGRQHVRLCYSLALLRNVIMKSYTRTRIQGLSPQR